MELATSATPTHRRGGRATDAGVELDVVIVSYRCRELVRDSLRSLFANPPSRPMRVHVIDNASADGTVEIIRAEFPTVAITSATKNLGFGRATNIGIRSGSGAYVLALNPDTRLRPGVLDHLLAIMDERSDIGIASCRLERHDGTVDHAAARSFPTVLGSLGHFTGLARRRNVPSGLSQYRALPTQAGPVDMVSGAFMLIRRRGLEEVGTFDEGYWMYIEDIDLCYRFAQAGWLTWYDPTIAVTHLKAATSGSTRSRRVNYSFHHGMYRFYRKHYARRHSAVTNGVVYAGLVVKFLLSSTRIEAKRVVATSLTRWRRSRSSSSRRFPHTS